MKNYTLKIPHFIADDLAKAAEFYTRQDPLLETYFYDSILADIESLQFFAGIHMRIFGTYRKLAKSFPFAIYYLLDESYVTIVAVLDMRKNPAKNRSLLQKRASI